MDDTPYKLDSKTLTAMRHKVQDALHAAGHPRPPMGHLAEAIAAGYRMSSHAALLALFKEWGGCIASQRFRSPACTIRLVELGHPSELALAAAYAARNAAPALPPDPDLPPIHWSRHGRMISGSKSGYTSRFPDNLVVFNAHVCSARARLWGGDLDVTRDLPQLHARARELDTDLYVFRESALWRHEEGQPLDLSASEAVIRPDGSLLRWQDIEETLGQRAPANS